jgi:MFS family permease
MGALGCMFIGDRLGRRRTIFLAIVTTLVGITLQSTPFSLPQLIVGRIVNGEHLVARCRYRWLILPF